ncbi:MAG: hypothetical protein NG737_00505 [Omnitrophica bacterium]|nr:hypothetical protein [Candidatus Omnitrophota bacterium]
MFRKVTILTLVLVMLVLSGQAYAHKKYRHRKSSYSRRSYCRKSYPDYSRRDYYRESYPDYSRKDYYRQDYVSGPVTKLAGGISQMALSWTEIPMAISSYSQRYDPFAGLILGTTVGTALVVRDSVEGAINTAFFLVPPYDTYEPYQGRTGGFFGMFKELDKKFSEKFW